MDVKKNPYDMNTPEAKALTDEIVHGTFLKEGTMIAFPLCFPGVTVPIAADESHITAMDVTADGIIYGGTSGRLTHLFVGMFHGVTGVVFDMGAVEGADHCAAVCCGKEKFIACVNGPTGRIITGELQPLPFDLIQEWDFQRRPFRDLGEIAHGEHIVHAVADLTKSRVVGTTNKHLFVVDIEAAKIRIIDDVIGQGRLAVNSQGFVFGLEEGRHLWRYDPASGRLRHKAYRLPEGAWDGVSLMWAVDHRAGLLYTSDAEVSLFSFDGGRGDFRRVGRAMRGPVGPMAVTFDGRLFGFCGSGISSIFCYDPDLAEVRDIGVAVSVIERRRYGYSFGDAVVGRDGQVVFGEDDNLGHLWLYFPRVRPIEQG